MCEVSYCMSQQVCLLFPSFLPCLKSLLLGRYSKLPFDDNVCMYVSHPGCLPPCTQCFCDNLQINYDPDPEDESTVIGDCWIGRVKNKKTCVIPMLLRVTTQCYSSAQTVHSSIMSHLISVLLWICGHSTSQTIIRNKII